MASNGLGAEARERMVDETLNLVDDLDADQARSVLRCVVIDDENFDARALTTIAKTVRATQERSRCDYDAHLHFPNGRVARLNREHLMKSRAMSAEAEKAAQKAAENAERSAQASQRSMKIPRVETEVDEGYFDQSRSTATGTHTPNLVDLGYEDVETSRLLRGGQVTINHYHINRGPEAQPQTKPEPDPYWLYCIRCNDYFVEKDNVIHRDGKHPCGFHTGKVVNYGNSEARAFQTYGVRIAGRAWNCCRRRPDSVGCNPDFHVSA